MSFKILIAEDHDLYRDGLQLLAQEVTEQVEVLEAKDYPSLLTHLENDIQLLLLNIKLPGTNGLDGLEAIRSAYPNIPIVVISTLEFDVNIRNVMSLGVNGFIAKSTSKEQIIAGLHAVLKGERVVLAENLEIVPINFTPRQIDTLKLLAQGLSNKEIAKELGISPTTVREYVSLIMQQLGADNRMQAVLEAKRKGFIY